ncbi:MauE/DoxX family redox-associated membrane protein [Pedobacter cryoconitis]|uniref:Putative membrane protein n=1 Tax=Pedobacter cryoconitis TaxID=188932 RepID=A0A7X0MMC7_9SPHI|nr:MauE/DoxX family redox-associated membrane protein [Pedobacter cryoconitis]MBB6502835.1 putative membrane protein [Pedobacter cryoconitis]
MEKLKLIFTWIFALFLVVAGINHLIKPALYAPFIPDWLPLLAVNYLTGIIEAGLGIALLFPKTRRNAAIGIILLMVFFLPFHLIDVFRTHPAIGSRTLAFIRLPFQFVLIYWAWFILPRAR